MGIAKNNSLKTPLEAGSDLTGFQPQKWHPTLKSGKKEKLSRKKSSVAEISIFYMQADREDLYQVS